MEYLIEFATAAAMVAFLCALLPGVCRRLNFQKPAYEVGGVGLGTAGVAAAGAAAGAGFFFAAASASLASTSAASIG